MAKRTRQNRITLDLSDDEKRLLEDLAQRLGLSMQDILRMGLRRMGEVSP